VCIYARKAYYVHSAHCVLVGLCVYIVLRVLVGLCVYIGLRVELIVYVAPSMY
jgi:hypothetical protein